jgi:hypothetical protein
MFFDPDFVFADPCSDVFASGKRSMTGAGITANPIKSSAGSLWQKESSQCHQPSKFRLQNTKPFLEVSYHEQQVDS